MADATQTSEVIARTFTPEAGAPGAPPLTPEQQRNQEAANALRQRLAAKPEDPLAALRSKTEKHISVDADKELDRRFGVEGVTRDTATQDRLNRARTSVEAVKKLYEQGFDALSDTEKAELQNTLISDVLNRRPAFRDLDVLEKTVVAEEILRNPAYQEKLKALLEGRLSPTETIEAEAQVKERREAVTRAEQAEAEKKKEGQKFGVALARIEGELDEFEITTKRGTAGAKNMELRQLDTDGADLRDGIEGIKKILRVGGMTDTDIEDLKTKVAEKIKNNQPMANFDEEIAANILEKEVHLDGVLNQITELEKERVRLQDEGQKIAEQAQEFEDKEILPLENDLVRVRLALHQAGVSKAQQEEEVVNNMQTLLKDSANAFLEDEIQKRLKEYQEYMGEQAKITTDKDENKIVGQMRERWNRAEGDRQLINREMVNMDYREMLYGDGLDGVLEDMVMEGLDDRDGDTPEVLAQKAQERTRIEQKLKTDKEFVKKWKAKIAAGIISNRLMSGRMQEGDIRVLVQYTNWGKQAIEMGIDIRKEIMKTREAVHGAVGMPGLLEKLRTSGRWHLILLLLLSLGLTGSMVSKSIMAEEGGR